jgi:hypothetical protein
MRNCEDLQARARATVAAINYLLDEKTIAERIDGPIDEAVASFRFSWEPSFSHREFVNVVGGFVAHVQAHLSEPGLLSAEKAKDAAVSLLVRYYNNPNEPGYDGALLDAATSFPPYYDGIDRVLTSMAEIMKATIREEYANWVHARYLDHSDRELLSAIVSTIQVENADLPLGEILATELTELAEHIPLLLEQLREVEANAAQSRSDLPDPTVPRADSHAFENSTSDLPSRRPVVLR